MVVDAALGLSEGFFFSCEDVFRDNDPGLEDDGFGDVVPSAGFEGEETEGGADARLLSDLIDSFVENIRVKRFVIEGFSAVVGMGAALRTAGGGGVRVPFMLRFSVLVMALTFDVVGRDCGDPCEEEGNEGVGDGCAFSALRSLGTATEAMIILISERI